MLRDPTLTGIRGCETPTLPSAVRRAISIRNDHEKREHASREGRDMSRIRTGGCLCGAVRYHVDGPMRPVIACHCRECRRQSGHYYAASQALRANVEITGADQLTWYHASAHAARGFCRHCGSALFFQGTNSDRIAILAGSVDEPSGLELAGHVFVSEQGDYYTLDDDLPKARGEENRAFIDKLSTSYDGEGA
jgi:hypothetical protein